MDNKEKSLASQRIGWLKGNSSNIKKSLIE